jgi:hypothetical protein
VNRQAEMANPTKCRDSLQNTTTRLTSSLVSSEQRCELGQKLLQMKNDLHAPKTFINLDGCPM